MELSVHYRILNISDLYPQDADSNIPPSCDNQKYPGCYQMSPPPNKTAGSFRAQNKEIKPKLRKLFLRKRGGTGLQSDCRLGTGEGTEKRNELSQVSFCWLSVCIMCGIPFRAEKPCHPVSNLMPPVQTVHGCTLAVLLKSYYILRHRGMVVCCHGHIL